MRHNTKENGAQITFRQENIIVIIILVVFIAAGVVALLKLSGYNEKRKTLQIDLTPYEESNDLYYAKRDDSRRPVEDNYIMIPAVSDTTDSEAQVLNSDNNEDITDNDMNENSDGGASESKDRITQTEEAIFSTLVKSGYTPAAACGILGNISVEDGSFEPDLTGNKGNTYGLFQWTDTGDRRQHLRDWCYNRKLPANGYEGQVAFAIYELEGGDVIACRMNQFLKNTDNPTLAAMEFAAGFERCVGRTGIKNIDAVYNGNIYDEYYGKMYQALGRRVSNAADYYERFKDFSVKEDMVLDTSPKQFDISIVSDKETQLNNLATVALCVNEETDPAKLWLYRLLSVAAGYLCGCILGAAIIARHFANKSIFRTGSGNPGLRNTLANIGKSEAVMVLLSDVLKTMLAFMLGYLITGGALSNEQILWSGLGVILGNDYPFWNKFKGGMGVVVTILIIVFYMPIWGPVCCLVGLAVALIFKSFPIGALAIGIMAVPFAFHLKGIEAGIFIIVFLLILIQRHYKIIIKYFHGGRYGRRKVAEQ